MFFSVYRQINQIDCIPTCLRMIARHYGRNYKQQTLNKLCDIKREGVSLLGISDASEKIGFVELKKQLNKTQALKILTLLLTTIICSCNTTYKVNLSITIEKAQILRDSARKYAMAVLNPKKANLYYDSLFMSVYVKKEDYYDAGQVAAEIGEYTKCIVMWSKMRKVKNDDEYDYVKYLPNMVNPGYDYYEGLIHTKGFKKLWSHYPNYPLVHRLSSQDSALAKKIELMFKADQKVRHNYIDSPTVKNNYLLTLYDIADAKSVDSIIINRGIITTKEFGNLISRDFCILFDHLPDSLLLKRMPLIEAAFRRGGIAESNYTLIKDRSLVFAKKEQLYGTQFSLDTNAKKNIFFPIRRIARVDQRRKKMGLGKLKYYAEHYNVLLPENYRP